MKRTILGIPLKHYRCTVAGASGAIYVRADSVEEAIAQMKKLFPEETEFTVDEWLFF